MSMMMQLNNIDMEYAARLYTKLRRLLAVDVAGFWRSAIDAKLEGDFEGRLVQIAGEHPNQGAVYYEIHWKPNMNSPVPGDHEGRERRWRRLSFDEFCKAFRAELLAPSRPKASRQTRLAA